MTTSADRARPACQDQAPSFVQVFSPLLRSGIPSDELHVYLILCDYAGRKGFCWPSDRTIGGFIGRSQATIQRILDRLEDRGLVSRTRVETTPDNPTGRVLTVRGRVEPPASSARQPDRRPGASPVKERVTHSRGRGHSNEGPYPASRVRDEPDSKEKKPYRPRAAEKPPAEEEAASHGPLRAAWNLLPDHEREEILAAVRTENPGLSRWSARALEPLCLEALAIRLAPSASPDQQPPCCPDAPLRVFQATGS